MDADMLRTDSEEDEHYGYTPGSSAASYGRATDAQLRVLAAEQKKAEERVAAARHVQQDRESRSKRLRYDEVSMSSTVVALKRGGGLPACQ